MKPRRCVVRDYANKFGVGYHESTNELRITVPDRVHLPATTIWIWLQDTRHIVLSPSQPESPARVGAQHRTLVHQETLPGCRVATLRDVRGIGPYFRMTETSYRMDGDRFLVQIPPEEARVRPKQFGRRVPASEVEVLPPPPVAVAPLGNRLVLIERGKEQLSFEVPDSELVGLIGEWILRGYQVRD